MHQADPIYFYGFLRTVNQILKIKVQRSSIQHAVLVLSQVRSGRVARHLVHHLGCLPGMVERYGSKKYDRVTVGLVLYCRLNVRMASSDHGMGTVGVCGLNY